MNKEIELKVLDVDIEKMAEHLDCIGAEKVFDDIMKASYFEKKGAELKNKGQALRIRQEGNSCRVVLKEQQKDEEYKIQIEHETFVGDYAIMTEIFLKLGYEKIIEQTKRRISYKYKNVKIDMDRYLLNYSYIPEFIEIEGDSFESIKNAISQLGLSDKKIVNWNFFELEKYYAKIK